MPTVRKPTPYSKNGNKPRFVYALVDPRDSRIRYVGCSYDPNVRLKAHLSLISQCVVIRLRHGNHAPTPLHYWLYTLRSENERPLIVILEECTLDNWREKENDWIVRLHEAGADLTNVRTMAGYGNIRKPVFTRNYKTGRNKVAQYTN